MTIDPDIEAMLTIDPRPRPSMTRASAWQDRKTPVRFTSSTRCHWARSISSAGAALAIPALFTARVSGPSSASVRCTASREAGGVGDVCREGEGPALQLLDLADDLIEAGAGQIQAGHVRADLGQAQSDPSTDPAGRSGDQRGLPVEAEAGCGHGCSSTSGGELVGSHLAASTMSTVIPGADGTPAVLQRRIRASRLNLLRAFHSSTACRGHWAGLA